MSDNDQNISTDEQSGANLALELNEPTDSAFVAESSGPGRNLPLLLIGLLIFGVAAIYFMRLKTGPASAAAATSAEATKANTTINEFLTGGQKNVTQMRETLRNTQKIVDGFLSQSQTHHVDVQELPSNPFFFGFEKPKVAQTTGDNAGKLKDEEKTKVRKAVEGLKLTTILGGSTPSCMINGKFYREAQEAGGFKINKINPKSVIVTKAGQFDNYAFELQMNADAQ